MKNNIIYFVGLGAVVSVLFLAIVSAWIGFTVADSCQRARDQYELESCDSALVAVLNDTNQPYRVRNDAIWALGQYGDAKVLPELEKYYTGDIPEREPYNDGLSQYELQKAIDLLNGKFNITVFFRALLLGRVENE